MGKDGLISILRFAGLDDLLDHAIKNDYPKTKNISSSEFQAFIKAVTEIMGHGTTDILIHYGTHYLGLKLIAYYGNGLDEMMRNFEDWLGGTWTVQSQSPEQITVSVENTVFGLRAAESTGCSILRGIFNCIMEQITGDEYTTEELECMTSGAQCCKFTIKKANL